MEPEVRRNTLRIEPEGIIHEIENDFRIIGQTESNIGREINYINKMSKLLSEK